MRLVNQIHIKSSNGLFTECERLCFASKNLYNQALYRIKEQYKTDKTYLNYPALSKQMAGENQVDYRALPSKVAQQTLMLLDKSYKSYFLALEKYNKSPEKFNAQPQLPNFKHKTKGRFVATFTEQAISSKELKNGFLKLSGSSINIATDFESVNQVRIVPLSTGNYNIEIVYEKEEQKKVENEHYAGIDIGLNNLATIVTNNATNPLIINGKPLKSINQYYNKKLAKLKSKLPHYTEKSGKKKQRQSSKAIRKLTAKRNRKVKDYMHKASRKVVEHLQQNDISLVIIGQNKEWKQSINLRKSTNQNFVAIPHARFIEMCAYKNKLVGVEQRTREESYTSKCSFLDNEPIKKHEIYAGRRIKRGMFKTKDGILINSDVNGAANILKKEVPNAFDNGIEGVVVRPLKLSIAA